MIEVIPFKREHLMDLIKDPRNQYLCGKTDERNIKALEENNLCYTVVAKDTGSVLGCGGLVVYWPGRAECWAVLRSDIKRYFFHIHRTVKRYFELTPFKRIEAVVRFEFEEGHRWMRALGFKIEASVLKNYYPDGDAALYARII